MRERKSVRAHHQCVSEGYMGHALIVVEQETINGIHAVTA